MITKEELLSEILRFVERKGKVSFTYEEFLVFLYYRRRGGISFGSIMVRLRKLSREGFIKRKYVKDEVWGFTKRVIFYPDIPRIRAYLKTKKMVIFQTLEQYQTS